VAQAIASFSKDGPAAARTGDVPAVVKADRLKAKRNLIGTAFGGQGYVILAI